MKNILLALLLSGTALAQEALKPLRAGIVGLDTSHVPAFTKFFQEAREIFKAGKPVFGAVAYGSKSIGQAAKAVSYEGLCRQIGKFFRSGQPPVSTEETIEIFTFMEAADESLRRGGKPVALAAVLAKAKAQAAMLIEQH